MKTQTHAAAIALLMVVSANSICAATEIKLSGRKDLVLSYDTRVKVLEVGGVHLSEKGEGFIQESAEAESPFSFDQAVEVVDRGDSMVEKPLVEKVINYNDASVLSAVATNFSKQVRGTLARGATSYLQLNGGSMIKPGTTFPVSIPQAKGQTFKVTISEITSNSYTMKLGDAEQTVSLGGGGSSSLNSITID